MLESPEQIECALALAGEPMVFPAITSTDTNNVVTILREEFTLQGIPGQVVYNIQGYESPADADKQDIIFLVAEKDVITFGLEEQNLFTYMQPNSTKTFTFKVNSFFLDFTGWVRLRVTLKEIA
jgi:hypothetical protein